MSNVTELKLANSPQEAKIALLNELTRLLLLAQEGRLTQFVALIVVDETYQHIKGNASKIEAIAMSSMLHAEALGAMRVQT